MKKKKIHPFSVFYLGVSYTILLCIEAALIFEIVLCILYLQSGKLNLVSTLFLCVILTICLAIALLFITDFVSLFMKKIVFDNESLSVPADFGFCLRKIQKKVVVKYSEIEDIYFIATSNDSSNKPLKDLGIVHLMLTYIVFVCKNRKKRICVLYFSKKQKIKIADEAISRAEAAGNPLNIGSGNDLWKKFCEEYKNLVAI